MVNLHTRAKAYISCSLTSISLQPLSSDVQSMKAVEDKALMEEEQTPLVRSSDHEDGKITIIMAIYKGYS